MTFKLVLINQTPPESQNEVGQAETFRMDSVLPGSENTPAGEISLIPIFGRLIAWRRFEVNFKNDSVVLEIDL